MKETQFGVITFKSTHYAIQADTVLKKENIQFRTIPTPREITHSCGLAIKFSLDDFDNIMNIVKENGLITEGVFKFTKDNKGQYIEKLN